MAAAYENYGITKSFVESIKWKLKQPGMIDNVKAILDGVTKYDLQNRQTVRSLIARCSAVLGLSLTSQQTESMISFVVDQRIDPKNTFHLIKLWGMFR